MIHGWVPCLSLSTACTSTSWGVGVKIYTMPTPSFQIHPQLIADSHDLCCWQQCHIRLHNNATLPWVIIIPESTATEFHDLPVLMQNTVTAISKQVSHLFQSTYAVEKINFAAIGNVVSQLHVHVIGRHPKDPFWPGVVWGQTLPKASHSTREVERIKTKLQQALAGQSS